jgi:hypothetical protein
MTLGERLTYRNPIYNIHIDTLSRYKQAELRRYI